MAYLNTHLESVSQIQDSSEIDLYQIRNELAGKSNKTKTKEKLTESLASRKETANRKVQDIRNELSAFHLDENTPEDLEERMEEEREYLGIYVTMHPLDRYPDSEDLGLKPILDADENTNELYGMIRDVVIKRRKSDRKPMAFFVLEDRTGEISVCAFTKQYERLHNVIKEGAVVRIRGNIQTEEFGDQKIMKLYMEDTGAYCC